MLLFQTTYAKDKSLSRQSAFATKRSALTSTIKSHLSQSAQRLRANLFPTIGYFDGPVLDSNDFSSIRQALSVNEGDGAAIIDKI